MITYSRQGRAIGSTQLFFSIRRVAVTLCQSFVIPLSHHCHSLSFLCHTFVTLCQSLSILCHTFVTLCHSLSFLCHTFVTLCQSLSLLCHSFVTSLSLFVIPLSHLCQKYANVSISVPFQCHSFVTSEPCVCSFLCFTVCFQ